MVLKKFDDEQATDYDVNRMYNECLSIAGLNLIRMLIDRDIDFSVGEFDWWGDAYIDTTGREDSVNLTSTTATFDTSKYTTTASATSYVYHNIPSGSFSSTISSSIGIPFVVDWEADADIKYKLVKDVGANFVVIEATSISALSDFAINDCRIELLSAGKWLLYCTLGTDEVRRAQIYKTLFYGTVGTNPRAEATYITGITALKTSHATDVGKQAHYAYLQTETSGGAALTVTYTGTFVNTSTNNNCSTWSYCRTQGVVGSSSWEVPSATVLNTAVNETSDEIGTDTSGDELNNPATCQLENYYSANNSDTRLVKSIVLCVGDVTWAVSAGADTNGETDFFTDNSIPLFTSTSETVTAEDSGWLDCGVTPEISSFTAFVGEPDELVVQLIPKVSSPTVGYPSIKGFVVRAT